MGVIRNHHIDNSDEIDFLNNIHYYVNSAPIASTNAATADYNDPCEALDMPTVIDIYNSSNQILIEPGIIDTLGNALMHVAGNFTASGLSEDEEEKALAVGIMDISNSSSEDEYVDRSSELRHPLYLTVIFCVAYVTVFLIGTIGNMLTVGVVYLLPRMRTVTNFFIASLAVADMLVLVICLPGTLMSNIFVPWVLGKWMCKVIPFIQGVAINASVYSLICVSLDRSKCVPKCPPPDPPIKFHLSLLELPVERHMCRKTLKSQIASAYGILIFRRYSPLELTPHHSEFLRCLAICFPLKFQMTNNVARRMITGLWLVSFALPTPWLIFFDLVPVFKNDTTLFCLERWPDSSLGNYYFLVINVLVGYVIPFILISICYILIYMRVWKRDIPSDSKNVQMEKMQQKSKYKVIKMLLVVVLLFVISWLPLYAIFARIKFGGDLTPWQQDMLPIVAPISQFFGIANSSINPVLYVFFNTKFRTGFWTILHSKHWCSNVRYYDSVTMANSSTTSLRKSSSYRTVRNKSLNKQMSQDKQLACISEGPIGV